MPRGASHLLAAAHEASKHVSCCHMAVVVGVVFFALFALMPSPTAITIKNGLQPYPAGPSRFRRKMCCFVKGGRLPVPPNIGLCYRVGYQNRSKKFA